MTAVTPVRQYTVGFINEKQACASPQELIAESTSWDGQTSAPTVVCDSGATSNLVPNDSTNWPVDNVIPYSGTIRTAGSQHLSIAGKGWYHRMGTTLLVNGLRDGLLSTAADARRGIFSTFGPGGMVSTLQEPTYHGPVVRTAALTSGNRYILDYVNTRWLSTSQSQSERPDCIKTQDSLLTSARNPGASGATSTRTVLAPTGEHDHSLLHRSSSPQVMTTSGIITPPIDELPHSDIGYLANTLADAVTGVGPSCSCVHTEDCPSSEACAAHHSQATYRHFHETLAHLSSRTIERHDKAWIGQGFTVHSLSRARAPMLRLQHRQCSQPPSS